MYKIYIVFEKVMVNKQWNDYHHFIDDFSINNNQSRYQDYGWIASLPKKVISERIETKNIHIRSKFTNSTDNSKEIMSKLCCSLAGSP